MTKPAEPARITIGDSVRIDQFFLAIDEGLRLWVRDEEARPGRAEPHAALCRGSLEAITPAIEILRSFARERKLVTVRATSAMVQSLPHGRLAPSQVLYRWRERLGSDAHDQVRAAPSIGALTFLVRPVVERIARGVVRVRAEVAVQPRRGGRPQVLAYAVSEEVDITYPLRPSDPGRLAVAASEVVRLAQSHDRRLAEILKRTFEAFEITIKNLLRSLRRMRDEKSSTLILIREERIETVTIASTAGGDAGAMGNTLEEETRTDEIGQAEIARTLIEELFTAPVEARTQAEQNILDTLASIPDAATMRTLTQEYVRLRGLAAAALKAAAADLHAAGTLEANWLDREVEAGTARVQALSHDPSASLELARRHAHTTATMTTLARARPARLLGGASMSAAQAALRAAGRDVSEALHRFYQLPEAYWQLSETLTAIATLLAHYEDAASLG